MTEKQWVKKFRPIKNHLVEHAPFRGDMFETYDEEWEYVRKQNPRHIWTYIEDEGSWLVSGFHWVNRMGYFITEEPWSEGDLIQVRV